MAKWLVGVSWLGSLTADAYPFCGTDFGGEMCGIIAQGEAALVVGRRE